MKFKKRILSLVLVALLILDCVPFGHASKGDELTLNGNILDAVTDMVYGWDGKTYRFDDSVLVGVETGDEVHLVADTGITGELTAGSRITLKLTGFRLEGADSKDYYLPGSLDGTTVEKEISILPRTLVIRPAGTEVYYGQDIPADGILTRLADYSSQIVEGDEVSVSCAFRIQFDGSLQVGSYDLKKVGEARLEGADAANYQVRIENEENLKFVVNAYTPDAAASDGNANGVHNGKTEAVLTAPEGFLISSSGALTDDGWAKSVTVKLQEKQNGTLDYYLRNDDADSGAYRAIAKKTYRYSAIALPVVTGLEVTPVSSYTTTMLFRDTSVLANGNVLVTVYVTGGSADRDMQISLLVNGEEFELDVQKRGKVDGKHTYRATMELPGADGESKAYELKAYAKYTITEGSEEREVTGERYPAAGSADTYLNSTTPVTKPLVIDRVKPDVQITGIDVNYQDQCIVGKFTVSDAHAGVAEVKYKWDDGAYRKFDGYTGQDGEQYTVTMSFADAKRKPAAGGKHTLYLRVTDALGNVTEVSYKNEAAGIDLLAPVIDSVALQAVGQETKLQYTTGATLADGAVTFVIKASDPAGDHSDSTGVQEVVVSCQEGDKRVEKAAAFNSAAGAYVLTVQPDQIWKNIRITVRDGSGRETTKSLTEVNAAAKSNHLYVDDDAPEVSISHPGYSYDTANGKEIWLGSAHKYKNLVVTVTDKSGELKSGIASVEITWEAGNQSKTLVSAAVTSLGIGSKTFELPVKDFEEGSNTIRVTVKDKCGNTAEKTFSFIKDTVAPGAGKIGIQSENKTIGGQLWTTAGMTLQLQVETKETQVRYINVTVNGKAYKFGPDMIKNAGNGYFYVQFGTPGVQPDASGKYTISGEIQDKAGNTCALKSVTVHVDKAAPTIESISVKQKDGSDILNMISFGIFANDTLVFSVKAKDADGDSGLDKVVIKYSDRDTAGYDMKWDRSSGCYTFEVSEKDLGKIGRNLCFRVTDKYGKVTEAFPVVNKDESVVTIESDRPILTVNFPGSSDGFVGPDSPFWFSSNKEITVKIQDQHSGINKLEVKINGVPIEKDQNGKALPNKPTEKLNGEYSYLFHTNTLVALAGNAQNAKNTGKYELMIQVTDNSGNTASWTKTFYVDMTPPQVNKISFSVATADGIKDTTDIRDQAKTEYAFFFSQDFDANAHVSDAGPSSGLYRVNYWFGSAEGEPKGTVEIKNGTAFIDVPQNFKGQIYYEVLDYAGNSSGIKTTAGYVVDKTAPVITIVKTGSTTYRDANGNPLYTGSLSYTVTIEDPISGLFELPYSMTAEHSGYRGTMADWTVLARDNNLVTKVQKVFSFEDNNDIRLDFKAVDHARRVTTDQTETFTVDRTDPIIQVNLTCADTSTDPYYNKPRVATITVTERNFRADLIDVAIRNTFGDVPGYKFTSESNTKHTATITFDEGDYTFEVSGVDLGQHKAKVSYAGGNENLFYVDTTAPAVTENFHEFANNQTENSFNAPKTATITIVEHHFDAAQTNLRITRKAAGEEHSHNGMVDVTQQVLGGSSWTRSGDSHSISFTFAQDAVYYVELAPVDMASNASEKHNTVVFEIDTTAPVVIAKNGMPVNEENALEFLDIYPYDRANSPAPTVQFADHNLSHLEYTLITYIPEYVEADGLTLVNAVDKEGTVKGDLFTLENFAEDGIYTVALVAVDVAGNKSVLNSNTYARMVDQDVLAFILNSSKTEKTGLYSLEDPSGEAISKKPGDFQDLQIMVLETVEELYADEEDALEIVLRDTDGSEKKAATNVVESESVYGVNVHTLELPAEYFRDNYQADTDTQMQLTVRMTIKDKQRRIDLASIHIDNIAPTCDLPEELHAWAWFAGEEDRTFTITSISETLVEDGCKVYDNGKEIDFDYRSEADTLTFTLSKGWHNVGIILSDAAGNAYIVQEMRNIHIGNFWSILMGTTGGVSVVALAGLLLYRRKRAAQKLNEEA